MKGRELRLADVAHELRSPLNAIRTWTHVLESQLPNATPEVRRALEGIRIAIEQQVGVIESLEHAARENP
jgi:signal transduction histidine kinase